MTNKNLEDCKLFLSFFNLKSNPFPNVAKAKPSEATDSNRLLAVPGLVSQPSKAINTELAEAPKAKITNILVKRKLADSAAADLQPRKYSNTKSVAAVTSTKPSLATVESRPTTTRGIINLAAVLSNLHGTRLKKSYSNSNSRFGALNHPAAKNGK
jgi:hypothetical protein